MAPGTVVELLRSIFEQRRQRDSNYSLRVYAKSLNVHSATLSTWLTGKRRMTPVQAMKIMDRLKVSDPEIRLRMIERTLEVPASPAPRPPEYTEIDLQRFAVIRDWTHVALLACLDIDPRADLETLARKLAVPADEVRACLERLRSVGLLRREGESWISTQPHSESQPAKVPDRDMQEHHRQHIAKALTSMEKDPIHRRELNGITMTVNPDKLPLMKKAMRDFLSRMAEIADDGEAKTVYRLNMQLFPLLTEDLK